MGLNILKQGTKCDIRGNDNCDTLNHMSRLKTFILGNKKLKPKTGRFPLIKSRLEIKKGRSLQINLFVLSICQWEKSLEKLDGFSVCYVSFFARFRFSFFLFSSPSSFSLYRKYKR